MEAAAAAAVVVAVVFALEIVSCREGWKFNGERRLPHRSAIYKKKNLLHVLFFLSVWPFHN